MDIKFTQEEKNKIAGMLLKQAEESGMPNQKYAVTVGLVPSDITNLSKENWKENQSLIGDKKWLTIARVVSFERNEHMVWKTAKTEVYEYVFENLNRCKQYAFTSILVDDPGIGKTYTAKQFARQNKNSFYMNCSFASGKREFMYEFSKCVGISKSGKLREQFSDALYLISQLENPIIILDEVGDLDNSTILLIKKIYNQLEGICGIYMIGSDGFKKRIENGIRNKTQGFTETFSRFGSKFTKALKYDNNIAEKKRQLSQMGIEICKANGIADKAEIQEIVGKLMDKDGLGDLRTIDREIKKRKIMGNV